MRRAACGQPYVAANQQRAVAPSPQLRAAASTPSAPGAIAPAAPTASVSASNRSASARTCAGRTCAARGEIEQARRWRSSATPPASQTTALRSSPWRPRRRRGRRRAPTPPHSHSARAFATTPSADTAVRGRQRVDPLDRRAAALTRAPIMIREARAEIRRPRHRHVRAHSRQCGDRFGLEIGERRRAARPPPPRPHAGARISRRAARGIWPVAESQRIAIGLDQESAHQLPAARSSSAASIAGCAWRHAPHGLKLTSAIRQPSPKCHRLGRIAVAAYRPCGPSRMCADRSPRRAHNPAAAMPVVTACATCHCLAVTLRAASATARPLTDPASASAYAVASRIFAAATPRRRAEHPRGRGVVEMRIMFRVERRADRDRRLVAAHRRVQQRRHATAARAPSATPPVPDAGSTSGGRRPSPEHCRAAPPARTRRPVARAGGIHDRRPQRARHAAQPVEQVQPRPRPRRVIDGTRKMLCKPLG